MIREAREAKRMSAEAACALLEISRPMLSMWETGARVPSPEWTEIIARKLEMDHDLLEIHCGRAPAALREDPLAWALARLEAPLAQVDGDLSDVRQDVLRELLGRITTERDRLTCIAGKVRTVLAMGGDR